MINTYCHTKPQSSIPASSFSVLLFSKTAGFRHSSIPDGIAAIMALGQLHNTEYDWSWYGQLVGAYFADHPPIQSATVQVWILCFGSI